MQYTTWYSSPLGKILLAADGESLTGLWFEEQKYFARGLAPDHEEKLLPVFDETKRWLDLYFSGQRPDFTPPLLTCGSAFQETVWELLQVIPYGKTMSYKALAQRVTQNMEDAYITPRTLGGALGRNPISIIIPCHRIVGVDGSLTGYAGGIERKIWLLKRENAYQKSFFAPRGVPLFKMFDDPEPVSDTSNRMTYKEKSSHDKNL